MRAGIAIAVIVSGIFCGAAQAQEPTVLISSRNQKIRAILLKPEKPVASVILLVGGHGQMDIAQNGAIKWGRTNQFVRTRANYMKQGFAVLVPDIAPDWKGEKNPVNGYRWNARHGADIGALVAYMRTIAEPVVLVGTSRAAVTAGVALLVTAEKTRPDFVVLTAPMLMPYKDQPSFLKAIQGNQEKAEVPMLVIGHKKDQCPFTSPAAIEEFRNWRGGENLDILLLDGPQGTGHPCEDRAAHGFAGIDDQVVEVVSSWIKRQKR